MKVPCKADEKTAGSPSQISLLLHWLTE